MTRAFLGALAVTALALAASMNSYEISAQLAAHSSDSYQITASRARFASALQALPGSGEVAYITDMPVSETTGAVAYMSAQYVAAPVVLVAAAKSKAEWALGNFAHPGDFAAAGAQVGFTLVRDFGQGVAVYRRSSP
jgi:hypothetical protein